VTTDPISAPPRDPELEAALAENPDDDDAYRAYALWLTERGDPHGELISAALEHEKKNATVREYEAATRRVDPCDHFKPEWRRGFIERAVCLGEYEAMNPESWRHYPSSEDVAEFLGRREARLLHDLELIDTQSKTPCEILLALPAPLPLRQLVIATFDPAERMTALWARFPRLRRLDVRCGALGELALLGLKKLTLRADASQMRALSRAPVPKLQELTAHLTLSDDADADALSDPLPACPELQKFALVHAGDARRFLDALLASPLLPRLHTLDLSQARFPEEGAEVVRAAESGRLDHLRRLDVGGVVTSKTFAPETVRRLRERLKERLGAR
jgi:uncharacterized protein (TIGR02996 family)